MGKLQCIKRNNSNRRSNNKVSALFRVYSIKHAVFTGMMYILALLMILPVFWMISASFKKPLDIFQFPIEWIPKSGTLDNYIEVWLGDYPFGLYYLNSLIVTVLTVIGVLGISSLAGYAFSRLIFFGRDKIFITYLAALMIPTQVTLIPKFIIFKYIGLLDSLQALILPGIFQVICVFLMRQFFMQIPMEYNEAAKIDGANEFTTFSRIILPMAKPALMTLTILVFNGSWNDYENPLIFITSQKFYTLPLGLNHFVEEYGMRFGPMMAASFSSVILIVIVFIAGQKYFIEGLTAGGIKG